MGFEGVPKWSQNRCKNLSQINAKTFTEKDTDNYETNVFPISKIMQNHRVAIKKSRLRRVCARTRNPSKRHQK